MDFSSGGLFIYLCFDYIIRLIHGNKNDLQPGESLAERNGIWGRFLNFINEIK